MSDDVLLRRLQAAEQDNARLRRLLERKGSMAGLRHQIRNTLAMVRDVVRRTAERFEGTEDFIAHLDGRLDAVLRIQNTIASGSLDGVPLDLLLMDELVSQAAERSSVDGPDLLLQPAAAGPLALAVHELAANAVKFGALAAKDGRIAVSWSVGDEDGRSWLTLRWIESGVDMAPGPRERGFGSQAIEDVMRHQFGGAGTLDFAPGGLRCTIRLPMVPWVDRPRAVEPEAHGG